MKIKVLVLLMIFSWSSYAQESEPVNPKLELLKQQNSKTAVNKMIQELQKGTVDDLDILIRYYAKDKEKKELFSKKLLKKYPDSFQARMLRMEQFLPLSDPTAVEGLVQTIIKDYPGINLDLEKNMAVLSFAEVPDTAKAMHYIHLMEDPYYKVFAMKLMIDIIDGFDSPMALALGNKVLPKVLELKSHTENSSPLNVDPQVVYAEFIPAYAKLLFKAGKYDEAYPLTKESYESMGEREDRELIENYAFLSSLRGNYKEALPILAEAVKGGKHSASYIEQIRKGYTNLYPNQDVNVYVESLKKDFIDKIKAHITPMLLHEAAPDFTVTDVEGKRISLADFKGKTIVLDFWATWCGPCVASFPAMQLAVNHFADDPDVKFLFIHTWENVSDPLTDAKSFLSKRNYNFDLYMDPRDAATRRSAAADAFKVNGIPAKFIIDGEGVLRFNVSGFQGTDEEVAEEVVQMVEMARKTR